MIDRITRWLLLVLIRLFLLSNKPLTTLLIITRRLVKHFNILQLFLFLSILFWVWLEWLLGLALLDLARLLALELVLLSFALLVHIPHLLLLGVGDAFVCCLLKQQFYFVDGFALLCLGGLKGWCLHKVELRVCVKFSWLFLLVVLKNYLNAFCF